MDFRGWLENNAPGGAAGTYAVLGPKGGKAARGCHDTDMYQVAGSCSNIRGDRQMKQVKGGRRGDGSRKR